MSDASLMSSLEQLQQISRQGQAIYNELLKPILEPEYNGQVVAIHLNSGNYEVAQNSPVAWKALRLRHPTGLMFVTDIGPVASDSLTMRMLGNQALSGQRK